MFTMDKPIIFNSMATMADSPADLPPNESALHVRGYKEEGTTTTPFDMCVLNEIDRYHLAIDVIDRVPNCRPSARICGRNLRNKLIDHWHTCACTVRTCRRSRNGAGLWLTENEESWSSTQEVLPQVQPFRRPTRDSEQVLAKGEVERVASMADAIKSMFDQLGSTNVEAVGHRIVHGGDRFHQSVIIDAEVEKAIDELSILAPLHNPHNLEAYRAAREHLPGATHVAVFDTAFHFTLPPRAYVYGLPYEYLTEKKIRRYGFHGISHRYVSWRFAQLHGKTRADYRMITCHLGNGCSVCAIDHGKSIDTSMGFTPLEGLIMGTRSGDVDAGAILHLITHEFITPTQLLQTC